MNPYESDRLLSEYLLFHYGSAEDIFGDLPGPREAIGFASRVVEELLDPSRLSPSARALDVGCAVGASSFALSNYCQQVIGVDYSERFIAAARHLLGEGSLTIPIVIQGTRKIPFTARRPLGARTGSVTFQVGDAHTLPSSLGRFEVVLAANLLCRLQRPKDFLQSLPDLLTPGGQLLLATPFTWSEEFTPTSQWIGGLDSTADSYDVLYEFLSKNFKLQKIVDLPMIIREHRRKFQYTISLGSSWIRR